MVILGKRVLDDRAVGAERSQGAAEPWVQRNLYTRPIVAGSTPLTLVSDPNARALSARTLDASVTPDACDTAVAGARRQRVVAALGGDDVVGADLLVAARLADGASQARCRAWRRTNERESDHQRPGRARRARRVADGVLPGERPGAPPRRSAGAPTTAARGSTSRDASRPTPTNSARQPIPTVSKAAPIARPLVNRPIASNTPANTSTAIRCDRPAPSASKEAGSHPRAQPRSAGCAWLVARARRRQHRDERADRERDDDRARLDHGAAAWQAEAERVEQLRGPSRARCRRPARRSRRTAR